MASCDDIVELALVLGLLRSAYDRDDKEAQVTYTKMAQKYYKVITNDCGITHVDTSPFLAQPLPSTPEERHLWDSDIVSDFADAVRPWLKQISKQCDCQCKGQSLNLLEKSYSDAIEDYKVYTEAVKELEGGLQ
jgi:hypothetical protein